MAYPSWEGDNKLWCDNVTDPKKLCLLPRLPRFFFLWLNCFSGCQKKNSGSSFMVTPAINKSGSKDFLFWWTFFFLWEKQSKSLFSSHFTCSSNKPASFSVDAEKLLGSGEKMKILNFRLLRSQTSLPKKKRDRWKKKEKIKWLSEGVVST